jgi:hypothetical protein
MVEAATRTGVMGCILMCDIGVIISPLLLTGRIDGAGVGVALRRSCIGEPLMILSNSRSSEEAGGRVMTAGSSGAYATVTGEIDSSIGACGVCGMGDESAVVNSGCV